MFINNFDRPKNGRIFRVLGACRISTDHQDVLSLGDQEAYYRQHLDRTLGPDTYELTAISGRGSGQYLDREEYLELCEKVESGEYDIVISEDSSRIIRRMHFYLFCEMAEDNGTRVIAINDHVDTKEDNWRQAAFFASFRHESYCRDTSLRIRRTQRNRFTEGRVFPCEIYGYIKPHAHATDDEVSKEPSAQPIYEEIFERLESGQNYRQVADWLNESNVATGPYCRSNNWTGAMVKRIVFNPILKGQRVRNRRVTVRVNGTGRPRTVPAPEGQQLTRDVSHLAFIEPSRYDRVIRMLTERNAKYRRSEEVRNDPRAGVPRRCTRWPGQHIRCGVCGRLFVFGGHGKRERLMCNGAREYKCWNGMTVSGPDVARAVAEQVHQRILELPEFDSEWVAAYEEERSQSIEANSRQLRSLKTELSEAKRRRENLLELLNRLGVSDSTVEDIRRCETTMSRINDEISLVEASQSDAPEVPTMAEINLVANEVFNTLAIGSEEFAQLMRGVVDDFFVLPFRLADGGHVQPKVMFTANLGAFLGQGYEVPLLDWTGVVDLTTSPKRVQHLADVVRLVAEGEKHADVAEQLGIFKTEVGYAMRLHRRMLELGVTTPWIPMQRAEQVADYFPRVRNPRFRFDPLPGFEQPKSIDD